MTVVSVFMNYFPSFPIGFLCTCQQTALRVSASNSVASPRARVSRCLFVGTVWNWRHSSGFSIGFVKTTREESMCLRQIWAPPTRPPPALMNSPPPRNKDCVGKYSPKAWHEQIPPFLFSLCVFRAPGLQQPCAYMFTSQSHPSAVPFHQRSPYRLRESHCATWPDPQTGQGIL